MSWIEVGRAGDGSPGSNHDFNPGACRVRGLRSPISWKKLLISKTLQPLALLFRCVLYTYFRFSILHAEAFILLSIKFPRATILFLHLFFFFLSFGCFQRGTRSNLCLLLCVRFKPGLEPALSSLTRILGGAVTKKKGGGGEKMRHSRSQCRVLGLMTADHGSGSLRGWPPQETCLIILNRQSSSSSFCLFRFIIYGRDLCPHRWMQYRKRFPFCSIPLFR